MISDLRLLHWPAQDRDSFAHFITVMAEVRARIQAISGEAGGVPVPRPPREPTPRECAAMILEHCRAIRAMAGEDGDLFGDPGWQIVLAVFQADGRVDDAALLEMAGLSPTGMVGARWIDLLLARGWVERHADGYLNPTDKMQTVLTGYFGRM